MTTPLLRPIATLEIDSNDYAATEGTVILDSSAVPYGTATLTVPLLDDATLEWLDHRDARRVPVTAGDAAGTPRVFDLGLRGRTADHTAKTVRIELATDEAILVDYATLTDDATPLTLAASLRAVVNYVLGLAVGASLEAGSDVNVTPVFSVTNIVGNSGFEGATSTGYVFAVNASGGTITTAAGFFKSGARGLRYTSTAAGATRMDVGQLATTFKARPGLTYTFSFWHRSSVARAGTIGLRFYNADGDLLDTQTKAFNSGTVAMEEFHMSAQAPAATASVWPYIITSANSAGQFHYLDDVMLVESEFLPVFFDGSTADTATYRYDWAGTVNLTQSIRTALVDGIAPDALVWRAGQSAWQFLLTLTAAAGMMLWCDENRDWRLQTPASRTIATTRSISGANTELGTDSLNRDDDDAYVTGIVARYRWTDVDGIARERIDSAGTPDKVLTIDFPQPYPGPGVAAAMLARRQGTGRVQDVTTITNWATSPGMTAQITLPGAPDTSGRIVRVEFDAATGFMTIGTSGLVDIVPGSIDALVGTINSLVGTINSL